MVELRVATADDRNACRALLDELGQATGSGERSFSDRTFDDVVAGDRGRIIVAEENGRLLGMATVSYNVALRYDGEYCQLEELIVSPAARGRQLGAKLVEQTLIDARRRGCADYGLYLVPTTEHNRPFYEKLGFHAVGTELRQAL